MNKSLCETCLNKDEAYIPFGSNFKLIPICTYNRSNFGYAQTCVFYEKDEANE